MQAQNEKVTFSKESQLPRLPVPPLNETLEKYITALEPIMFDAEYENTKNIVREFQQKGGIGEELQTKLLKKAASSDNWLAEWWDRCAYFGFRAPVCINSSPGISFPAQNFYTEVDQYRYAAQLIHTVLDFKHRIDNETLPVDYAGKNAQTMVQYKKLLSHSRLPCPKYDGEVHTPAHESRHIIVMHNNHFFKLNIYKDDVSNTPLSEEEIVFQLDRIVNMSRTEDDFPVGVLTSLDRNAWAQGYKRLTRDSHNRDNVDEIIKSIFVVCLDQPVNASASSLPYEDSKNSACCAQMLHGGGSQENSMNRWFDKICQFVVNRNGMVGMCYEHSAAEGPPIMALCNEIFKKCNFDHLWNDLKNSSLKEHLWRAAAELNFDVNVLRCIFFLWNAALLTFHRKFQPDTSMSVPKHLDLPEPNKFVWSLNYDLIDRIELAKDHIDSISSDISLHMFQFDDFGKSVPKRFKMSPDAFFQVSLQLAYYRLHAHHPPTYESASIRKFKAGRTECIRSATPAAARYAREMDRDTHDNNVKRKLFLKAVEAHVQYTRDAINFQAIDRHLLGLKLTALEHGMPLPELFRDKAYGYAYHFRLSTSQVPAKDAACLCFGPVVPDGYGVCYNPMENQFLYVVTSFNSHPKTHAGDLGAEIAKALQDNHALLLTQSKL